MPDRCKCTSTTPPPPPPPPLAPPRRHDPGDLVFRRTLTWRFPNRSDAVALDRIGEILSEYVNEMHLWGPEGTPFLTGHLGAIADDLEDVAAAALWVAESSNGAGVAAAGSRWAERLAQIAVEIRTTLGTLGGVS